MSRGKKKAKLQDYSRLFLSAEDRLKLREAFGSTNQHPMATAILGCVFVEHELEVHLRRRLRRKDDNTWAILCDESGPLRSFNSKILLAHALGTIDDRFKVDLDALRKIRNAFAHSKKVLEFNDPLIVKELLNTRCLQPRLKKTLQGEPTKGNVQGCYIIVCLILVTKLLAKLNRATSAKNRREKSKLLASALLKFIDPNQPAFQVSNLGSSQDHQSADPTSSDQKGFLAELFREFSEPNDSADK